MVRFDHAGQVLMRVEGGIHADGLERRIAHAGQGPGNPRKIGGPGQHVDIVHFPEPHAVVNSIRQEYALEQDQRYPLVARDHADQLDDEGKRLLGVVSGNVKKMTALIDALLTLSRTGRAELKRSAVEMTTLATSVLDDVLRQADAEGKVVVTVSALPDTVGDSALLRQVWTNLLANAVKFSRKVAHPAISVEGRVAGDEVVYSVRDNGAGFDMAHASKLFGTFQRLHNVNDFEGTGVGLALVKQIVTRHGGRVWAEGKVGKGATFSFALPQNETSASAP